MKLSAFGVASLCLLAACSEPFVSVADPKGITLEKAMKDLGSGFAAFDESKGKSRGLVPCQVSLTFNVGVKAEASETGNFSSTGQLVVTSVESQATTSNQRGFSLNRSRSAERSNQIQIELRHLSCLPKDTRSISKSDVDAIGKAVVDNIPGILSTRPQPDAR